MAIISVLAAWLLINVLFVLVMVRRAFRLGRMGSRSMYRPHPRLVTHGNDHAKSLTKQRQKVLRQGV
jgi:hypothetical protein